MSMKNYSNQIAALLVVVVGIGVAQFGFSEACSGEITEKMVPILGAAPGLIYGYLARLSKGDVKLSGIKKY